MKKMTLPEQRRLYEMYRDARMREASNLIQALSSGTYSSPTNAEIYALAKQNIFEFIRDFEVSLQLEVEKDLKQYQ